MPAGETALTERHLAVAHLSTAVAAAPKGQRSNEELYKKSNRKSHRSVNDVGYPTDHTLEKFPDFYSSSAFKERLCKERSAHHLDLDMHLGTVNGQFFITKLTIYSIEGGRKECFEVTRGRAD
jgi:hypothetical protein